LSDDVLERNIRRISERLAVSEDESESDCGLTFVSQLPSRLAALREESDRREAFKSADWNDKNSVLPIVSRWHEAFALVSSQLRDDRDVALAAVKHKDWEWTIKVRRQPTQRAFSYENALSAQLLDDKDFALDVFRAHKGDLFHHSKRLRDDKEFVMETFAICAALGRAHVARLSSASDRLKDDREVVYAAMQMDSGQVHYASQRIKQIPVRNAKAWPKRRIVLVLFSRAAIPTEITKMVVEQAGLWEEPM